MVAEVLKDSGITFSDFVYMLTRRVVEPERFPNDRVEIMKEKLMTKDMHSLSNQI